MIPFFPKQIANKGIIIYLISLAAVSIIFFKHAMGIEYILLGLMWVIGFFSLASTATKKWASLPTKQFCTTVFWVALAIRIAWVVFSYFFYISKTGQPFEFGAADAIGYHEEAKWLASEGWGKAFQYWGSRSGVSDNGYSFWLMLVYSTFGPSIIVTRLIKAIFSSITCIIIYKLAKRNIGEYPGRMASIFFLFMPNLIYYCGLHVKEIEMIFLICLFLERADNLFRNKQTNIINVGCILLLAGSLFFFRTVLGSVAILSVITALIFSPETIIRKGRKVWISFWIILSIIFLAGGTISTEIEGYWTARNTNTAATRSEQTGRGNQWAKYATGAVMSPMAFVLPFSTMIHIEGQEDQMVLSGGNYIRNFLGIFFVMALFYSIFIKKEWRRFSLIGSYVIGYLLVVANSGFSNSERFLLPALPVLLIMASYGISVLDKKNYKYVNYWAVVVVIMEVGWAYFKLGSRGII